MDIWKNTLFIFIVEYCTCRFRRNKLGEEVQRFYWNGTIDNS